MVDKSIFEKMAAIINKVTPGERPETPEELAELWQKLIDEAGPQAGALFFRRTLGRETDRGCALVAGAYLEDQLGQLLRAFFIDEPNAADGLLSGREPLASFSARIQACFCLGLISKEAYRDLNIIRKIRNEFAHHAFDVTFDAGAIADRCRELKYEPFGSPLEPRAKFMRVCMGLAAHIHGKMENVERRSTPSEVDFSKLHREWKEQLGDE
jgi:hypothetical protein